jgi:cobalamin synthase
MKILEMFIIVIIAAVGMFGLIYASSVSTNPADVTDSFGHTLASPQVNSSYGLVQNTTAIEVQGSGAGIIVVAACVILIIIFAVVVLTRGQYSKGKYRT